MGLRSHRCVRSDSIDDMTNLSLKHRDLLKDVYEVGAEAPVEAMCSTDGTVKYLYRAGDKNFVEAVYIPDEDRATLCVSSQVGCKMNCKFCMTGKQGFSANLTANQIIFLFLYFFLGEGMGESDCVSVPFQIISKIACDFFQVLSVLRNYTKRQQIALRTS